MRPLESCCRSLISHSREYDKRQHFFYSLVLMLAASVFWGAVPGALVVALIGLAKECWDHFWGSGYCWLDMLANMLGIVAGGILYGGGCIALEVVVPGLF